MASAKEGNGAPTKKTSLHDLYELQGLSPWYDNLCRPVTDLLPLIASGVRGVTSNPTVILRFHLLFLRLHGCGAFTPDRVLDAMQIFQKAISSSSAYDDQFKQLISGGKDAESAYWELVIKDIQDACSLFEPIYDETDGADGYVSVEVSPRLANDTQGTVEAAKWLHKVVNRPNVYIKIPATAECVPSIREVIANGISVNVTVIAECCLATSLLYDTLSILK
jgi:transaldolase